MQIYTIQLPQVPIRSRHFFLDFVQRNCVELALKNKALFAEKGLNAEFFHKDKQAEQSVPVSIHALQKDGILHIRAYGDAPANTLRFWKQLFAEQFPQYSEHILEASEFWTPKRSEKPLYYRSTNWIPFRKCAEEDSCFFDAQEPPLQKETALQSRLIGNLRTFLNQAGLQDIKTHVLLLDYPDKSRKLLALKTKVNGERKAIYKQGFEVCIKTHLVLPMYFSLGQNVGYGNGVFVRE